MMQSENDQQDKPDRQRNKNNGESAWGQAYTDILVEGSENVTRNIRILLLSESKLSRWIATYTNFCYGHIHHSLIPIPKLVLCHFVDL